MTRRPRGMGRPGWWSPERTFREVLLALAATPGPLPAASAARLAQGLAPADLLRPDSPEPGQVAARLDALGQRFLVPGDPGWPLAATPPEPPCAWLFVAGPLPPGPAGLLQRVTRLVLEGALEGELTDHLGYEHGDPAGRNGGNSRNGTRSKTVLTEVGPDDLDVPRDRDATFQPRIVRKRQRRLGGVEDLVVSLVAKGLTTGEVAAHLAETDGTQVSRQTISTITDRVPEGLAAWQSRPLDPVDPVLFIDAICGKIGDGQVANRPVYVALGVTVDGERDLLGLWPATAPRAPRAGCTCSPSSKHRGVGGCCIVVCDGLAGLPDAISTVWPQAGTQTWVVDLLRNSFRDASRRDWAAIATDLKPVSTAPTETAALDRFAAFAAAWEGRYPAIIKLWEHAWAEFVPFLAFDLEIRTVICTTNAIERRNARFRRGVKARGHFPDEQAAPRAPGPDHCQPRPHRPRTTALDQPLGGRAEGLRQHLRRPRQRRQEVAPSPPVTPFA